MNRKRKKRQSQNQNAEYTEPSKGYPWRLYKVSINGSFHAVVKAPFHDAVTSRVRNQWLVMEDQTVEVSQFATLNDS